MAINTITVSGNLGHDADCRTSAAGDVYTRLSIAFPGQKKKPDGSWEDSTGWIDAVIFGKRGKNLTSALKKGVPVVVSGRLSYSTYLDANKNKRSALQIIVGEIFIGAKRAQEDVARESDFAETDIEF